MVDDSGWCGSAEVILSHDALKDFTALAELKAEGRILERHVLLLQGHIINDHRRVVVLRLEGLRMVLRVRRMRALTEEEHVADVDSKVVLIQYHRMLFRCL